MPKQCKDSWPTIKQIFQDKTIGENIKKQLTKAYNIKIIFEKKKKV